MLIKKILNTIAVIATLVVNFLAVSLPLNGKTPRQLSDQYPNYFTPAPITFTIWSVIYLFIIAFVAWQFLPLSSGRAAKRDAAIGRLGWRFVLVSLLNMLWLVCWHYELVAVSVCIMLVLLSVLIGVNRLLFEGSAPSTDERWLLQVPFGIYLGWISVATVANITAFLVKLGWNGWGMPAYSWAVLMIAVAVGLALWVLFRQRNYGYALAVAWACTGIYLKHHNPLEPYRSDLVMWTASAGAGVLALAVLLGLFRWLRERHL
jgi:hypothetical protein